MENERVKGYEIVDTSLQVYPDTNDDGDNGLVIQISNTLKDREGELTDSSLALFLKESYIHALDDALFDLGGNHRAVEITTPSGAILDVTKTFITISSPAAGAVTHNFENTRCKVYLKDEYGENSGIFEPASGEYFQFRSLISAYCDLAPKKYLEFELDMLQLRSAMSQHNEEELPQE